MASRRTSESGDPTRSSPEPTWLDVLAPVALWLACLATPPTLTLTLGPLAGLIAALVSIAAWIVAGPRPFPGLLPGLMAVTVLLANASQIALCAYRLLR